MRHKYATTGFVLSRIPLGEASASVCLLTPDLGVVYARAQSVRKPGAKLAAALQTFSESDVILVRGKEGWRLSGAVLADDWFSKLDTRARARAGRITGLVQRLVHGDTKETPLHSLVTDFLAALAISIKDETHADAAEILVALRLMHALGLDAGELPGGMTDYSADTLQCVTDNRADYVLRINRGIAASGL